MVIEKSRQGDAVELKLSGWLDTQTSPMLAEEVMALDESVASLIIDCSDLEYISSAGMRQIVAAHKKVNGALTLCHVSSDVADIINMTGLGKRLHIEA